MDKTGNRYLRLRVLFDFLNFGDEINLVFNNEWNKERVLYLKKKKKVPLPFFNATEPGG